ncbi:MAG: PAS domain S-box protein, partial [Magnetococcales bacterium]|nr:PAS domain S-box protein [Magnetococcales bacterium]
ESNAVCEFELDGTILSANDNFLAVMGYRLDEVVGKHHRMFAEPEYAAGVEYAEFWAALGRGEYQAAEYKRLAKGGRPVWIQASYNPIFDADGTPVKVVKFATDITEESLKNANYAGQVEAINKSNAVIEFDLDGTILTANEGFLQVVGYTQKEVTGQHHRMFVDAEYAVSAEYTAFWQALGRGEYQAAEYRRLAKGGRPVWIQASYNPIFDRDGKPFKVVKFATDITERKEAEALIDRQQQMLLELSTPAMQLFNGVVLMPLVGNIDGDRATQLISRLLEAISTHEAEVAILDLTGVPIIDTDVARHLLKTVAAAKMLGSVVILTGINPNGAQTLVQLGIDISHITTKGTLRSGIEEAFRLRSLRVVDDSNAIR